MSLSLRDQLIAAGLTPKKQTQDNARRIVFLNGHVFGGHVFGD